MIPAPIVEVRGDAEELALSAARFIAARFSAASTRFSVSLSGGATPKRIYELLAVTNFTPPIDWQKIHLFWGDERFVPPDHEESNFAWHGKPCSIACPSCSASPPDPNKLQFAGESRNFLRNKSARILRSEGIRSSTAAV